MRSLILAVRLLVVRDDFLVEFLRLLKLLQRILTVAILEEVRALLAGVLGLLLVALLGRIQDVEALGATVLLESVLSSIAYTVFLYRFSCLGSCCFDST